MIDPEYARIATQFGFRPSGAAPDAYFTHPVTDDAISISPRSGVWAYDPGPDPADVQREYLPLHRRPRTGLMPDSLLKHLESVEQARKEEADGRG